MKQIYTYCLTDCLTFGKYKGFSIQQVLQKAPKYILWCLKNVAGFKMTKEAWQYATSIDTIFIQLMPEEYRDDELVEKQLEKGIELLAHYPWKDKQKVRQCWMNYVRSIAEDIFEIHNCEENPCICMTPQLELQF